MIRGAMVLLLMVPGPLSAQTIRDMMPLPFPRPWNSHPAPETPRPFSTFDGLEPSAFEVVRGAMLAEVQFMLQPRLNDTLKRIWLVALQDSMPSLAWRVLRSDIAIKLGGRAVVEGEGNYGFFVVEQVRRVADTVTVLFARGTMSVKGARQSEFRVLCRLTVIRRPDGKWDHFLDKFPFAS